MDDRRFDGLTRNLCAGISRRGAAAFLGAAAMHGLWRQLPGAEVSARKKKHKRCVKTYAVCDPASGPSCCGGNLCCPAWTPSFHGTPETAPSCAPAGATCCSVKDGGSWCREGEKCCPVSPRNPQGWWCESLEGECCTDDYWGSCGAGFHCCNQPKPGSCCPNQTAAASEPRASVARNFRRRGE